MKFKVTGLNNSGNINADGDVIDAKGGTEMMKEGLLKRLDPALANQYNIICSRVREISEDKKNILWLHDTFNDPEAAHLKEEESRKRFAKLVFVSDYQWNCYSLAHGIRPSESIVLKNAIEPIKLPEAKEKSGPLKLIYHTTPHRGLEILVPVFERLYEDYGDKIHLDVFSSFNIYGWPQRDEPYQELFQACKNHKGITYHGTQPNEVVREYLAAAHIFAYPCVWPETSCISLMEAMSASVATICPNLAALPETSANFAVMYQYHEDPNVHANIFANVLNKVIDKFWQDEHQAKLNFQKIYADNFYSWDQRILEWDNLLKSL